MSSRKRVILGVTSLGLALGAGYAIRAAASGIPATAALTYAGVLEDANGPVNGPHNILLILYDAVTAGNNLCQSASVALTLANGHFAVPLPDACTTAVGANPNVWVDVLVDGSDTGRTKIGAVPYAVEANHAVNATNATTATNATSATNATNATNCTNATNATNASNAAGALGTAIAAIQGDVSTLQSGVSGVQQADTNFVDLSSNQAVGGNKTFENPIGGTFADGAGTGGAGGAIIGHSGHSISFSWDTGLHFWVDATNVATLEGFSAPKTFIINHPTDPDRYLVHATLEGPESAVFYRGSAHLHRGLTEVTLPSYFEAATREDARTVLVTPTFDSATEPVSALAASRVRHGSFVVRAIDRNNPDQTFDWEVKAVRADLPALVVEPRRDEVVVRGDGPYRYVAASKSQP